VSLIGLTGCGGTEDTIAIPGAQAQSCPGPVGSREGVAALYTFDADEGRARVMDSVGGHDAAVQDGLVRTVSGPDGCNQAFSFADHQYFIIDDSPDWDLEIGSIDLWLRLPLEQLDHIGVFSRDLLDRDQSGHVSLFIDSEGRGVVRVQPQDSSSDNRTDAVACTAFLLPRERWIHLGVNFGPPILELYVNGSLTQFEGPTSLTDAWECGQIGNFGIAGNALPWVVGRSTFRSEEVLELLEFPALGCAIDNLRISRTRRAFSTFF
jgi:hypothetical protein